MNPEIPLANPAAQNPQPLVEVAGDDVAKFVALHRERIVIVRQVRSGQVRSGQVRGLDAPLRKRCEANFWLIQGNPASALGLLSDCEGTTD